MSEKVSRKELKQPDAFQKMGVEASAWLVERRNVILVAVVVAIAGGGIASLVSYLSRRGDNRAAKELGAAMAVLERPVEGEGAPPAPGQDPAFKSQKEKDEALVKDLTSFRASHAGSPSAVTAALALAQAHHRLGAYDQALQLYDEFLAGMPAGDPLRAAALEGKGYAYEAKQSYDQALGAFETLANETKAGFLEGMGQYHRARMLILQGKKEEGAKLLSELPATYPGSSAARLASDRLALLAAEGVKVPPPAPAQTDAG